MSVVTPTKIFIDPREEITFILERIFNAEKDKVIVVIPQNSLILSSIISLKILQRRSLKSDKTIILVTEDAYGLEIASKVGLVSVAQISDITPDIWSKADEIKQTGVNELNARSSELIEKRQPSTEKKGKAENTKQESKKEEKHSEYSEEKNDGDSKNKESENLDKSEAEDEELEKELKKYQKPRREPKEVTKGGLTILAGGDIRTFQKSEEDGKMGGSHQEEMAKETDEHSKPPSERKMREVKSFTGQDFTKKVKSKSSFFASLFKFEPKNTRESLDPDEKRKKQRRRQIIAGSIAAIVLLGFLGSWYYVTAVFSSVDIEISFTKEDVSFNDRIVASAEFEVVNAENLEIPSLLLTEDGLDTQLTGTATGSGERGEKANGFVTMYNTTPADISITQGTILTNVGSNLTYQVLQDVTVSAASLDENDIEVIGKADDVPVEASEVGEEYNIEDADSNAIFEIQGFSGVDEIYAKRFQPFEGGSSETFTAVDQSDVDALENEAKDKLLEEGTTQLRAFVPNGFILLEETIQFVEDEIRPFPAVGEEAEDGTFTFNISGSVNAIAVKRDDLEDIANEVISEGDESKSLEDLQFEITEVVRDEDKVSFIIDSQGSVASSKSIEELQDLVKGEGLEEAERLLADLEEIEEVTITYSPSFVPSSFQSVPNDAGRITIRTN